MFPCNCHSPFPRPEPFSPLPRPGKSPDWGKWIRDRLAEKGALLAFPTRTAFPSAGDAPNLYLAEDTGVVYRWGGEGYAVLVDPSSDVETHSGRSAFPDTGRAGVIYIDASANLIYRWNGTGYVLLTTDLSGVESRLADVESKVPAQATAQNQLADKAFVNSSIATNTAFYITDNGRPFQSLADLETYEGALTNNDYAFVVGRDAAGNTTYTRYKWNEATEAWGEEYVLNNSSFTAEQWAAISSGITSGLVAKLGALPTAEALAAALAGKQDALTFDNAPTSGSNNPVKSGGIWAALWGALASLPSGFSSLYDWCVDQLAGKASTSDVTLVNASDWVCSPAEVGGGHIYIVQNTSGAWYPSDGEGGIGADKGDAQSLSLSWAADEWYGGVALTATRVALGGYVLGSQTDKPLASETEAAANRAAISTLNDTKADKSDLDPLLFAQYYPEGNVKSVAEFTAGIKYDAPDTTNRTITVKPFCNTDADDADNDNSSLVGRVVIPPFVDAQGDPYISDDGTRFKVVGVSGIDIVWNANTKPTAIIAPSTVTTIGISAFDNCPALASVSLPAATTFGEYAFDACSALASVSLPAATTFGKYAFYNCPALASISLPAATTLGNGVFGACPSLTSVDFGDKPRSSVPTLGANAFDDVPTSCKIIVPDAQYDEWVAAPGWSDLVTAGYKFLRHSEWEYARKYEVDKKADKPATFTAGNLAALDANGNPTDSGVKASDKLDSTSAAPAFDATATYDVGKHVVYNGRLYRCTTAVTTAGPWNAANWTADDMTSPDATLDITAQNQLRVIAKDGTVLWAQGYDLASTSSATLACDAVNNFTFADGATTQAFALPTAPSGKVGDFGLDIDNSANTSAATLTLTGLDTAFSVVVPEGESLNDMLAIAAGELAQFYITLTTFRVNNLPTWHIVKQVVENGGATA